MATRLKQRPPTKAELRRILRTAQLIEIKVRNAGLGGVVSDAVIIQRRIERLLARMEVPSAN